MIKLPDESNLKGREFILTQGSGKPRLQGLGTTGHVESTMGKWKVMMLAKHPACFLHFILSRIPCQGRSLSPSVNIEISPHPQACLEVHLPGESALTQVGN